MKHIPMLSFLAATSGNPSASARRFTTDLVRDPTGNMALLRADCRMRDRKNVWSFTWRKGDF